ncbi:MAG: dephospho-CoA kinase [Lysobacterales bacterium]|nr:MAG: dephospho-CoA kinase [Xanthomonadales bacterium]
MGITGGIGSGKTTVAGLFAVLGVPVIDADELARQVVMPGQPAYEAIVEQFGNAILMESGELDRRRLREHAFSDPEVRTRLEEIVHPRVYDEVEKQLDKLETPYAIVVVPLLIESGGQQLVDRVLVVDTAQETQIERTKRRDGTTRETIKKMIAAQLERGARLSKADDVIENDSTVQALEDTVAKLHHRYLDEASRVASQPPEMKE